MAINHFYFGFEKQAAMPQGAWNKLRAFFEGTPDVFDVNGILITPGTPPSVFNYAGYEGSNVWSRANIAGDAVIYEAYFDDNDITILAIRQKLANAAGVALNTITVSTILTRFLTKQSAVVSFKFNGTVMFIGAFFGRASDTQVMDWRGDSLPEAIAYLAARTAAWDG